MKALWKRIPPIHPRAGEVAVTGLRLAALLAFCAALLLCFGGPFNADTYYKLQNAVAIRDVVRSVLLLTVIGTAWMQTLYKDA